MDELSKFCQTIKSKLGIEEKLSIDQAREIVKSINNFLYSNYDGIGKTHALGTSFEYFSEFHRYWEKHHREILNCEIDEDKCKAVAEALHSISYEQMEMPSVLFMIPVDWNHRTFVVSDF